MSHYCSVRGSRFRRNVKVVELFPEEASNELVNKKELLAAKGIQLRVIPNRYVKHYEFIRELINKFNGEVYARSLFDGYEVG